MTLDSDTEQVIRERMTAQGVSFKKALNQAIRDGAASHLPRVDVFHTRTFDLGEPAHDVTHALREAADLEDAAIIGRMHADG